MHVRTKVECRSSAASYSNAERAADLSVRPCRTNIARCQIVCSCLRLTVRTIGDKKDYAMRSTSVHHFREQ
jgi:hypothetical protein